ncbi:MAG: energy transducer TonB [Pseudomonadota bacterium]
MRECISSFFSFCLHAGVAASALHWVDTNKPEPLPTQVYALEIVEPPKVKPTPQPVPPPKGQGPVRKKKTKKNFVKANKKKKLVVQKQKSPVKVVQAVEKVEAPSNPNPGIEEGVRDARLLKQQPGNRPPLYSQRDRLNRNQGRVVLRAYVDAFGKVSQVSILESSGTSDMNQNALSAFSQYRFVKGQEGWVEMPYEFKLVGNAIRVLDRRAYR